jgi:hypothetical protein
MNWLAFIAAVVGSLAWPLTIVTVVLIFRRQLLKVAPWLREVEVGNVKMKFAEQLAKAATVADDIQPQPNAVQSAELPAAALDRDLLVAEHAPKALVIESWMTVEQALERAAEHLKTGSVVLRLPPTRRVLESLQEQGSITTATAQTIKYLRELRNQAAHTPNFAITTEQALEYTRLARKVVEALGESPGTITGIP